MALGVEARIRRRHDATAGAMWDVQPRPARFEGTERGFSVLADAPLVPPAHREECAPAEQSHCADEGNRVALVAGGHDGKVEALVRIDARGVIVIPLKAAVALEGLEEAESGVGEVADCLAEVVRLDDVVGVDESDALSSWVRVLGQGQIAGSGLVAGPRSHVDELHPGRDRGSTPLRVS